MNAMTIMEAAQIYALILKVVMIVSALEDIS